MAPWPASLRRHLLRPTRVMSLGVCLDTFGEEHALACAPPTVRRVNHTLTIQLTSGRVLTFIDDSTGEAPSGTMYRGSVASVPLYFTSSYGGERPPTYNIISGRDGSELGLSSLPVFSPDSARFAVNTPAWSDCELGDGGELAVWRMTDTLPAREWQLKSWNCDSSGWGATDLHWRSPDTLAFTQNDISDKGNVLGAQRPRLLVRSGDTWQIGDPVKTP